MNDATKIPAWLRNEAIGWFWSSRGELGLSEDGSYWIASFGKFTTGGGFIYETHNKDKTLAVVQLYEAVKAQNQREELK